MISPTETATTDPDGKRPNPFSVPDLKGESMRPLLPWRYSHHEDYYLEVDHTEAGYDQFCDFLGNPLEDLAERGRLVVVAGERGCGKSSLINRCVNYIKEGAGDGACGVIDLTTTVPALDFGGVLPEAERVDSYLDRLAHTVVTMLHDQFTVVEEIGSGANPPAQSAYWKASRQLGEIPAVAVVILPPFEDAVASLAAPGAPGYRYHPVKHYMGFRESRIIFFAESLNARDVHSWHDQLGGADREDVLVIDVGPLDGDDGWTFTEGRVLKCGHADVPRATKETMRDVLREHGPMSLSQLQKACFALWRDASSRPDVVEISKRDFDRYYQSRAGTYQRRARTRRNGHQ